MMIRQRSLSVSVVVVLLAQSVVPGAEGVPSYNRDVRPILAANCFACHGPDKNAREAGLRLDKVEGATADLDGHQAVKPGQPQQSELIRRITTANSNKRMPPPDSDKKLSAEQIDTLRRWIAAGAKYERHWAFIAPKRTPLPKVQQRDWPRNGIDHFVLARLESAGLKPSPEADRYTLVRRVYLDLIGLPPTPAQADAFVNDRDPRAYDELVDRLLQSPHYGERWARRWLDLARYSDTNGYEKDRPRSIWPYRDWVIRALNDDMPFDRFSIKQLAGDMLPNATVADRVATGFHRNTMLNEEGGIDPLEYRFYAMVDRVATTGTVWLGMTTGCAQCHSHKYDPISHVDYYRLMALLNNADEPDLIVPDAAIAERRHKMEEQIARLQAELPDKFPPAPGTGPIEELRKEHLAAKFSEWLDAEKKRAVSWTIVRPFYSKTNLPKLEVLEDGSVFSSGDITKRDLFTLRFRLDGVSERITALRLEVLPDDRLPAGGPGRAYYEGRKGDFFLSELTAKADGKAVKFASASHDYGKIAIGSGNANAENVFDGEGSTGWSTAQAEGKPHQLVLNFDRPVAAAGVLEIGMLFERHFAASLGRFRFSVGSSTGKATARLMPVELERLLTRDAKSWTPAQRQDLRRYFLSVTPELAAARKQIDQLRRKLPLFSTTLVMQERPADNPRKTYRHHRGEYLNPREEVTGGLPQVFPPLPAGRRADRLTFARWLVSERNPLVGRVTVNRAWQAFFGTGIVETSGDFGTQSSPPTHPDLLDWLARTFIDRGWSMKTLHRLIVTSAAYRQSSRVTRELLKRDPENRLLARGPRFRVDAEMVRDIVLQSTGLLSAEVGGKSVYPPQPASVTGLAYGNTPWKPSTGGNRYRRSLYTFSKRTAPFAAYLVFDAPTGENCIARRDRSNTPLQALTLLNDEMFLEMSRKLAERVVRQQQTAENRAESIFRQFVTRPPNRRELSALLDFQRSQLARFEKGDLDPAVICKDKQATSELAAWVMVARAVMNLEETITKQ